MLNFLISKKSESIPVIVADVVVDVGSVGVTEIQFFKNKFSESEKDGEKKEREKYKERWIDRLIETTPLDYLSLINAWFGVIRIIISLC